MTGADWGQIAGAALNIGGQIYLQKDAQRDKKKQDLRDSIFAAKLNGQNQNYDAALSRTEFVGTDTGRQAAGLNYSRARYGAPAVAAGGLSQCAATGGADSPVVDAVIILLIGAGIIWGLVRWTKKWRKNG